MKIVSVIFCALFYISCAVASDERELEKKPITRAMKDEGLEHYQTYHTQPAPDLLELARQKKFDEAYKTVRVFALQKLELPQETGDPLSLLLVNSFCGANGYIEIFEWDEALGDHNYEVVNQRMYHSGFGIPTTHKRHCTGLTYSCRATIGDTAWFYTSTRGYFEKNISPLWHCTIDHVYTDKDYKNKGIAKRAIAELIKFMFNSTSVDFLNASIASQRKPSQRAFFANHFEEVQTIDESEHSNYDAARKYSNKFNFMTLDGGQTCIRPMFYPEIGGNFYLSRTKWSEQMQAYSK